MNTLIVYGSSMGNTKNVAEIICEELQVDNKFSVKLIDVQHVEDCDYENRELVIFGSSTWNYGDLQTHFRRYIDQLPENHIANKDIAIFGCGDKFGFTSVFCKGVDIIKEKVIECSGNIIVDELKVDRKVEDNMDEIKGFIDNIRATY